MNNSLSLQIRWLQKVVLFIYFFTSKYKISIYKEKNRIYRGMYLKNINDFIRLNPLYKTEGKGFNSFYI